MLCGRSQPSYTHHSLATGRSLRSIFRSAIGSCPRSPTGQKGPSTDEKRQSRVNRQTVLIAALFPSSRSRYPHRCRRTSNTRSRTESPGWLVARPSEPLRCALRRSDPASAHSHMHRFAFVWFACDRQIARISHRHWHRKACRVRAHVLRPRSAEMTGDHRGSDRRRRQVICCMSRLSAMTALDPPSFVSRISECCWDRWPRGPGRADSHSRSGSAVDDNDACEHVTIVV